MVYKHTLLSWQWLWQVQHLCKVSLSYHRRRSGSGGPAFAGPMFLRERAPLLRALIIHGHVYTVCKHGTCRLCLTKVHETATPLLIYYIV